MAHSGFGEGFTSGSSRRSPYEPSMPSMAQSLPFTTTRGFDILEWHPAYQSCQRYFLDHAQYEAATQALCALLNIRLPFQWRANAVLSSTKSPQPSSQSTPDWMRPAPVVPNRERSSSPGVLTFVSLIPYIRRLVVTGFDADGILHGFFGDAWKAGTGPLRECERRNYLFAAKSGGWGSCKAQYDLNEEETVPFMQPLKDVASEELDAAEKSWSSWLALEDWMVGPRGLQDQGSGDGSDRYDAHTMEAESSRRGRQ